ncbi:MAG: hypothetical protein V4726_25185 [Verrucomicrobiota bacterium]
MEPPSDQKTSQAARPSWMGRPVQTLEQLRRLPYGAERDTAVLKMLAACTAEELKTVIMDPASRLHERSAAMKQWAELEPQGCFQWYRAITPSQWLLVSGYDDLTSVLFRTWARKDPEAAMRAARSVAHREDFSSAQWEVASAVMGTDLTKGLRLACDPGMPVSPNSRLTAALWEKDPAAFVKSAGELLSSGVENRFLNEGRTKALELWYKQDPAAAWAAVNAMPRTDRVRLLPQLLKQATAAAGVEQAAALLSSVPAGSVKSRAGRELLKSWAKTDPEAAIAWMGQNLPSNRADAMGQIITSAAETHPEKALKLVSGLEAGPMRDRAMAGLADGVGDDAEKAAPVVSWLLSQPADEGRRGALGKLTSAWVEQSPEQADAFLKSAAPGEVPDGLAADLAHYHFSNGADSALKWALTLGENQREQAVSSIIYRSAVSGNVDQTMTMGLLRALPEGQAGEQALQAVIYGSLRTREGFGAMAAALPENLKAAAVKQVRGWKEGSRGQAEVLKALGQ